MTSPNTRRWLYGVAASTTLLLGAYGILDDQLIAAWNFLAAAIFGVALNNTGTAKTPGRRAKVEHDDI